MNIINRKKHTDDRPELRVPEHLAEWYPGALEHVREHSDALTDRNWFENLQGGRLRWFVAAALGDAEHGGIIPGVVDRPGDRLVPATVTINGRVHVAEGASLHLQPYDDMPEALQRQWDAYYYSEAHKDEFEERVTAVVTEVLASPARAWEAHQHLTAIDRATEQKARADEAEKNEAQRLRVAQCPVCGDSDTARIGRIQVRMLLDGADPKYAQGESLRSCHLCWEYAHEAYLMRNAATSTGDNRAELVAAALARKDA